MPIELPKFENTYGLLLTACGKLKGVEARRSKKRGKAIKVAQYQTPAGRAFVRTWLTSKKERYLHVDCALQKYFPRDETPKVTCKKEEVLQVIKNVIGQKIDSSIEAWFEVPLLEIPENGFIRSLALGHKLVDMSMSLTGAELSWQGAPLKKMRWAIREERKKSIVHVWIMGERQTVVSDKYLSESWNWINEQFGIFILGRRKHA